MRVQSVRGRQCTSSSNGNDEPQCYGECRYDYPFSACGKDCICYYNKDLETGFCGSYEDLYNGKMDPSDIYNTRIEELNKELETRGMVKLDAPRSLA
ncbi:hypothetical protein V5799_033339 [Amblyomma americanum]|uniref:Uncharacterized protein n=1 Tax=Amblyomma americanum TaxID=6943 RepID=A0AAQ4DNL2_AMBAM